MRWLAQKVHGLVLGACFAMLPVDAAAQPAADRFELGFGGSWIGTASLGASDANGTTADGGTFRLFSTDSEIASMAAIDGRMGVRVWRNFMAEGSISYGSSEVRTDVSLDVEGAAPVTATEPIRQVAIEGAIVAELSGWRFGSRAVPFVRGGVGYLRQLHEEDTLAESGTVYRFGGGVNYILRGPRPGARGQPPRLKGIGLRTDIQAVIRSGGVALSRDTSVAPAFGASVFFRF